MADDSPEMVKEAAESVNFVNTKALGDAPAFYTNMAYANAVSHQQSMNVHQQSLAALNLGVLAKSIQLLIETSPSEGGADIAALMQLVKAAQTTPPVTP